MGITAFCPPLKTHHDNEYSKAGKNGRWSIVRRGQFILRL